MNEYSLKILAYIIKGFFLSINKSYLMFIRDIEKFIEVNIHGIVRNPKKINTSFDQTEKKKKCIVTETEKFTIQNLSLFSENTFFEKFLENSNMTEQIQKTLKRINKTFSSLDFENLSTEKKKEYLQKHFIKPLTESIPITTDFFLMSNGEEVSQGENGGKFSDFIQFDINPLMNDEMFKSNKKLSSDNIIEFSQEGGIQPLSMGMDSTDKIKLIEADVQKIKSTLYRKDNVIEIDLVEYLAQIDNTSNEDDSEEIYVKNVRELMKQSSLQKFMNSINKIDNYENEKYNEYFTLFTQDKINEDPAFQLRNNANNLLSQHNSVLSNMNDLNDINRDMEIEQISSIKNGTSFGSLSMSIKSQHALLNERLEIQNALNQILSKLRNYQEVTINHLTRKVTSQLSSLNGKDNKETASSIFYNMLIVCQNNQYQFRQSEPFGNFYIAK